MIEVDLRQVFSPWTAQELSRIVATRLDEDCANLHMEKAQKYLYQLQLSPSSEHFFEVRKVDVRPMITLQKEKRSANLWRAQMILGALGITTASTVSIIALFHFENRAKIALFATAFSALFATYRWSHLACEFFYPDQIPKDREAVPFDVILSQIKGDRKPPKNFDLLRDDDPLTCEKLSEEILDSPHMIFLPSYIANAKGCIRLILAEGKPEFCDPVDRRTLNKGERKLIMKQITRIFGVSQADFLSCFDPVALPPVDPDYRGVDKQGNYTPRAKEALTYAINELHDSSLKEIDSFFSTLEGQINALLDKLRQNVAFRETFYQYVRAAQEGCNQEILNQRFPDLFSSLGPPWAIMSIPLGTHHFIRLIFPQSFFTLSAYEAFGSDSLSENARQALTELKNQYTREIRLDILQMTPFNHDLQKEEEGKMRVARFEDLTGIKVTDSS